MTLEEFREDLINEIKALSIESVDYPADVFIEYCKDILVNDFGVLSELNHTYYEYKATNNQFKSMRIDASYLERSINTLHLLYCDFNDGEPISINNEYINQKANLLTNFFINVTRGYFSRSAESDVVTQTAIEIRKKIDDIKKLHLIIISTNNKSERLKTTINLKPIVVGDKEYNIDLTLLDISGIFETKLQSFKRDDIIINVEDYGFSGIPCIKADINSEDYDSYLAVVPGKFLADIYMKFSARLLESNVRSFLNTRGEINKGILNTILYNKSKFFAYNNGIATIADDVQFENTPNGLMIKSFKNLQIINGGQTTASLASAIIKKDADLSGIFVQMKLSLIKNIDEKDELVRLIAKYANKQNKVTAADLNSNHPFYAKIEEFSRKIKAPLLPNATYQTIWFFERARGQYDQSKMKLKTKKDRDSYERINPKNQKFTKTDLAKYINASEKKPYDVSWGAEVNMTRFQVVMEKEWDNNSSKFNELYYKDLIAKAIVFKTIEKIISEQDWYIANKGNRDKLVPYTFSKFIHEIDKTGKCFNYKKVWEQQSLQYEYYDDLKKISKLCFDVLNDPNRPMNNVAEYAKREICWKEISSRPYSLCDSTLDLLIDKEDRIAEERAAQKEQKFDDEVSSEIKIFNLGIDHWKKIQEVGKELGELNQHEIELCDIAIKYIKRIYLELSKKQTKEILELDKKMEKYLTQ